MRPRMLGALCVVTAAAVVPAAAAGAAAAASPRPVAAPSVVVLRVLPVAARAAARGSSSEAEQRAWAADVFHAQERVLARLAARGLPVAASGRFAVVLAGFAARLAPEQQLALEADPEVAGVYPARPLRAVMARSAGTRRLPRTLAAEGVAVAVTGAGAAATATLAGQIRGGAPGAAILELPLAGRPPAVDGLLRAFELAADPDGDGAAKDAARILAVAGADPGAAFADAPVAKALAGLAALDVVVVEAGVDGGAAVAVRAAQAAVLVRARPGLPATAVRALLSATAAAGGLVDLAAALAAEVTVEPVEQPGPAPAGTTRAVVVRSVSTRPLSVGIEAGGGKVEVALVPGGTVLRRLPATALLATATVPGAGALRFPLAAPDGPLAGRPAVPRVSASLAGPAAGRGPTDAVPARLSVVVAGAPGLARLDVELWQGRRRLGLLVRVRDLLPGRYVVAVTGRDPSGARLPAGAYRLRVLAAASADGAPAGVADLTFPAGRTILSQR